VTKVTVVDYGLGNLYSVARALRAAGADVELSADRDAVLHAERLVLPGVGAFRDGMAGLEQRGLVEPIREFVRSGRPLLGICLGMQLLMSRGTEFGDAAGLALVSGSVVAFGADGRTVTGKVPHVGWSSLVAMRPWTGSALAAVPTGSSVYFSHSYFPAPDDGGIVLATATHAGIEFCSFIRRDNIQASQFHPDMSGGVGLAIMKGFVDERE
jgi:imidazole glycerol-phosphate synthase subunit HisH